MAVPKSKITKSKRNMRRAHDALSSDAYVEDKVTGELHRPHHIDLKTGMYRGKQVLKVKERIQLQLRLVLQGALNSGFYSCIADRHHPFMNNKSAKFGIGAIVRHRVYPFRGVVVDVDPEFDNTDEWYEAIPAEVRPDKEQPFYHLLAENSDSYYTAYVSQQNLLPDGENGPVSHPDVDDMFDGLDGERYVLHPEAFNQAFAIATICRIDRGFLCCFSPNRQFAGFFIEISTFFFKNLPHFALKKRADQSIYN